MEAGTNIEVSPPSLSVSLPHNPVHVPWGALPGLALGPRMRRWGGGERASMWFWDRRLTDGRVFRSSRRSSRAGKYRRTRSWRASRISVSRRSRNAESARGAGGARPSVARCRWADDHTHICHGSVVGLERFILEVGQGFGRMEGTVYIVHTYLSRSSCINATPHRRCIVRDFHVFYHTFAYTSLIDTLASLQREQSCPVVLSANIRTRGE